MAGRIYSALAPALSSPRAAGPVTLTRLAGKSVPSDRHHNSEAAAARECGESARPPLLAGVPADCPSVRRRGAAACTAKQHGRPISGVADRWNTDAESNTRGDGV